MKVKTYDAVTSKFVNLRAPESSPERSLLSTPYGPIVGELAQGEAPTSIRDKKIFRAKNWPKKSQAHENPIEVLGPNRTTPVKGPQFSPFHGPPLQAQLSSKGPDPFSLKSQNFITLNIPTPKKKKKKEASHCCTPSRHLDIGNDEPIVLLHFPQ